MSKPRTPSQRKAYRDHAQRLIKYAAQVQSVYDALCQRAASIVEASGYDGEGEFSFGDYADIERTVKDMMAQWVREMQFVVHSGTSEEWKQSNIIQDLLAKKVLKSYQAQVDGEKAKAYFQPNSDALKAFQERADHGMNLSDRIWNSVPSVRRELECTISTAVEKGFSAVTLSKRLSQYLSDFPSMQRDYTEKYGHAADCRDCEYNSIRLARTEINMAYRTAEQKRWQQFDFVTGYEIKLSGSHPRADICDDLQGKYPKDFVWTGWHPQCYSDDSEVLTSRGWLLFRSVEPSDKILSLNPETRNVEWVGAVASHCYERKGEMVRFHNKSLDCLVTPEHQMVYLNKCDGRIKKCPAKDYTKGMGGFYRSCKYDAPDVKEIIIEGKSYDFDLFCEFMGYWLSDGSIEKDRSGVVIAQKDGQPYKGLMIDSVRRMGFEPNVQEETITFYNSPLRRYLSHFGKAHDKYIPLEIKTASKRQIMIFLDAFIKCDGSIRFRPDCRFTGSHGWGFSQKTPERVYFTTSERMAGDLSELILKVGHRPSFGLSPAGVAKKKDGTIIKSNYDCWRITECLSVTATVFYKETVDYDGNVYDLTLERNHIMYIRRNGKCFWGSNCLCMALPIIMSEDDYWRMREGEPVKEQQITEVPDKVHEWVGDNADRIERAAERGTLPYWLRDNAGLLDSVTAKNVEPALREIIVEEKATFTAATSLDEARNRLVGYGFKTVELGDASLQQVNTVMKAVHEESLMGKFDIDRLVLKPGVLRSARVMNADQAASFFVDKATGRTTMTLQTGIFEVNQYQRLLTWEQKIEACQSRIDSLRKDIEGLEGRLGRNKSADRMIRQMIKDDESKISDWEIKLRDYQKAMKSGEKVLPETIATTFEKIDDQVRCTLHHEFGHYHDHKLGYPKVGLSKDVSVYGSTARNEHFAECWAKYSMGSREVPEDMLKLFDEYTGKRAVPPHIETYKQKYKRVFVSQLNKEPELSENVRLARFLAGKTDEDVYVLPHIQPSQKGADKLRKEYFPDGVKEGKNPDLYYRSRFVDEKVMNSTEIVDAKQAKRNIQNRLRDAFRQADDAYLEIPTEYPIDWIENAVKGKLNSSSSRHVVYVKYGDELLIFR